MNMLQRDIRRDRSGGIEGLPLQLMIIILVATMGTAVIVGWMGSLETPHSIGEVTVTGDEDGTDGVIGDLTVRVTDQDGNYLEGATVVLQGLNVRMPAGDGAGQTAVFKTTDGNGTAEFTGLTIDPVGASAVGFIDVIVSKAGYGEDSSTRMTVVL